VRAHLPTTTLLVLAACGPSGNPLTIHYDFTAGDEQACVDDSGDRILDCSDVPMSCDAVALLRIIDPEDPDQVFVDLCVPVERGTRDPDLCGLERTDFEIGAFPTRRVELQLAIYARSDLDSNAEGNPICPTSLDFTATGFAAPTFTPAPALAGRAYADGYDDEVTIHLGCNNRSLIDSEECRNENAVDLTASVIDFDQRVSVDGETTASNLFVRMGEPEISGDRWVLPATETTELSLEHFTPDPQWEALNLDFDALEITDYACIEVIEGAGRTTPSVTCEPLSGALPNMLDLTGIRVEQTTLGQVLEAAMLDQFPLDGMVLGVVVDFTGTPVIGVTVSDSAGSAIEYVSADRTSIGASATTASGLFLSTEAPFDHLNGPNRWTVSGTDLVQRTIPVGGRISNLLTVMIIELELQSK
jgi:hypothetical protein